MIKRLILLCILASGCGLYWGDDKQDDCVYNGGTAGEGAPQGQRDPSTGICDYNYGGGGGYCDGSCGPCPEAGGADIPARDWGSCNTACDALDESTCIATSGCHAAYLDTGYDALVPSNSFYGCWATAPQWDDPAARACAGLDAQDCSELDNCSMIYTADLETPTSFEQCVDESVGSCNEGQQCPMGSHCEQQCAPCNSIGCNDTCAPTCVSDSTCDNVDCGTGSECVEQCGSTGCAPTCVPSGTDPGSCTGTIQCNSAPPTCPTNTTPGIVNGCWSGYCIPTAECGSHDPGLCYAQVLCNSAPPSCPSGTLPGITNGCWSGYCIPTTGCEMPACEALATEDACDARSDCTPVYTGTDCTCTISGCTCATETYARCESLMMPL
jgi:hypothetical protein